jgi:hypothetical protein
MSQPVSGGRDAPPEPAGSPQFPPLRLPASGGPKKVVGFDTSPSSVLRRAHEDSPGSSRCPGAAEPVESPLAAGKAFGGRRGGVQRPSEGP